MSAVRAAVACGADAVEIDVRRSRDGEFVVVHDATLGRTTDVCNHRRMCPGPRVNELTLKELRRLDAGAWKGQSFVGERIPTLDEVLNCVAAAGRQLVVEVKPPIGRDVRDLTDLAAVLLDGPLPQRRITVQSFDARVVEDLRGLLPSVTLAVLVTSGRGDLASLSRWADQVSLHHRSVDRRAVDTIQGWGMRCVTWTVNHPWSMRRMLALGVDGVITDDPDGLLRLATTPS
jgi:glycerophosphoryl diester phosphodiesterase